MKEKPVIVKPYHVNGKIGIDILVNSDEASVMDYCRALDEYILRGSFQRERAAAASCEGCDTCCRERIPLTSIDAVLLKAQLAPGLKLNAFLNRCGYISVRGPVVDISLGRDVFGTCLLLAKETGKCSRYPIRPLVCRTYICTPLSPRAEKLRETIVNSGMDELVRLMLADSGEGTYPVHEAEEPAINMEDWPAGIWTGKTDYSQLRIIDIAGEKLWRELKKR